MSHDVFRLQSLLLDLLSPIRQIDPAVLRSLDDGEWAAMLEMARQHRVCALLHWQARRRGHVLPAPVMDRLGQLSRQHAMRALTMQRELVLLGRLLREAGIPFVALKGAYLAFHAYPESRLRPLRDIDILVPHEQVLRAYQVMLDNGLTRCPDYPGDPAAALAASKHLPPLSSASGQAKVELHDRLFDPSKVRQESIDLARTEQFWSRCVDIPVGGEPVRFESPTDLLLHLIVHAVYDHEFNNGPLLLSDLAFLLDSRPIDWALFWRLAQEGGHTQGCILALTLTERYWGEKPITWPADAGGLRAEARARWESAAALMLQDISHRGVLGMANGFAAKAPAERMKIFWRWIFPPRTVIAAMYPVREHSARVYLWYAVKWWKMARRVPAYLGAARQSGQRGELNHVRQLKQWLRAGGQDAGRQAGH